MQGMASAACHGAQAVPFADLGCVFWLLSPQSVLVSLEPHQLGQAPHFKEKAWGRKGATQDHVESLGLSRMWVSFLHQPDYTP